MNAYQKYVKPWREKNPERWKKIQNKYKKKYYKEKPYSRSVAKWRTIIVNTLGNKCFFCSSTERLEIHEKNGFVPNITINDLILLCRKCHREKIHNLKA